MRVDENEERKGRDDSSTRHGCRIEKKPLKVEMKRKYFTFAEEEKGEGEEDGQSDNENADYSLAGEPHGETWKNS